MAKLDPQDEALRLRLAAHVRRIMHERGWHQSRLARELDVTTPTISTIVSGRRSVGLDVFAKLHRKLGINANELLDLDPPDRFFDPTFSSSLVVEGAATELAEISAAEGLPRDVADQIKKLANELRRAGARKR
jgi:transcriptional regulator with XRE-family HTH domain